MKVDGSQSSHGICGDIMSVGSFCNSGFGGCGEEGLGSRCALSIHHLGDGHEILFPDVRKLSKLQRHFIDQCQRHIGTLSGKRTLLDSEPGIAGHGA